MALDSVIPDTARAATISVLRRYRGNVIVGSFQTAV